MALLKERLKNGEQVLGTMVTTFASPDIAKILQSCGFDFFIVDMKDAVTSAPVIKLTWY